MFNLSTTLQVEAVQRASALTDVFASGTVVNRLFKSPRSAGPGSVQKRAAVHIAVKTGSFLWRQFGVVSSENKLKFRTMKFRPALPLEVVETL